MTDNPTSMRPDIFSKGDLEKVGKPVSDAQLLLPYPCSMEPPHEGQNISGPADKEKEDIPCPCGDGAHKNLEKWFKEYSSWDDEYVEQVINAVVNDKFDEVALKVKIEMLLPQVTISNGYCTNCQTLLENLAGTAEQILEVKNESTAIPRRPHFKDTLEFEASYRNGCRLCALFLQCSEKWKHSLEIWHRLQNRLNCLGKTTGISISVQFDGSSCRLWIMWPGLKVFHFGYPGDPLECIKDYDQKRFVLRKEKTPLLSVDGFHSQLDLAKKWLDACSETHESCKSTKNRQLPTRLIDVTSTPIHLVLSSTFVTKPSYATLSHCWGTHKFLKLQEDSLEYFMSAIPEEKLTKTFRDAIHITRSLGLQYVWIDSLCIIQNSDLDWQKEAALMSSVYGGSTINIAAAGAIDGTKGCFLKPPNYVGRADFELAKNEVCIIAVREFVDSVAKSHLASRAWALQERLLSPRTLHFSKTELFWECQHCAASESFPEGLPSFENSHVMYRERKPLSEIWHTIVRLYTATKLTFQSDKLVALSGIARQVQEENQDLYFAGLWRKDIESQLLWVSEDWDLPEQRLPKGRDYRAPSWSWASMNAAVSYSPRSDKHNYAYYSHVIEVQVPAGNEPFGDLVGGVLNMSCSAMLRGILKNSVDDWYIFDFEVESLDGKKECFRVYPDSEEHGEEDIYILPVIEDMTTEIGHSMTEGLLLHPTGNKKGEYTRIGTFNLGSTGGIDKYYLFQDLLEESGKAIAGANCAEILEDPKFPNESYIITII